MSDVKSPIFVVFEGVDRCGKNVQVELLCDKLRRCGHVARKYTTPDYSTTTGHAISSYLKGDLVLRHERVLGLHGSSHVENHRSQHDALALECLQICNRYEVASKISAGLDLGDSAVCARWWQSALLYGAVDGIDTLFSSAASSFLPEPTIQILLNVDPAAVARRLDAGSRYEADLKKQAELAASYERLWRQHSGPEWVEVFGEGSPEEVGLWVWQAIRRARPDLGDCRPSEVETPLCGVWHDPYNKCREPAGHLGEHYDGDRISRQRSAGDTITRPDLGDRR